MYRKIKHTLMTLLLSAAMTCTVVGCGQKTESTTAAAAGNTAEVQAETENTAEV